MQKEAESWANTMNMEKGYKEAEVTKEQQQQNIQNSTASMLDVMMNDPDPRFKNSEFLHFLRRIENQEIIIEGKTIREVKPDEKMMENAWTEAEKMQSQNMEKMETGFKQAEMKHSEESLNAQKSMQEMWANKLGEYEKEHENNENFEKMLEEKYMQVLKQMNLDLNQAWSSATDLEEQLVHGQIKQIYKFSQTNPYMDVAFPKALALELIN